MRAMTCFTPEICRSKMRHRIRAFAISIQQERVVITKDSDFVDSFLTTQEPYTKSSKPYYKCSELERIFELVVIPTEFLCLE